MGYKKIWVLASIGLVVLSGFFSQLQPTFASSGQFGVSPDNNQALLFSLIRDAKRSLWINIYEFNHESIAQEVLKKIHQGVCTHLLVEGAPVGGVSKESSDIYNRIYSAMKSSGQISQEGTTSPDGSRKRSRSDFEETACHSFKMMLPPSGLKPGVKRRFRFDHAKYVIADGQLALVSSENFSLNGHPDAGRRGTRGWDFVSDDSGFIAQLQKLFTEDSSLVHGDVQEGPYQGPVVPSVPSSASLLDLEGREAAGAAADLSAAAEPAGGSSSSSSSSSGSSSASSSVADSAAPPVDRNLFLTGWSLPSARTPVPSVEVRNVEVKAARTIASQPIGRGSVEQVSLITSPHSAPALIDAIRAVKSTLDLEFMTFPKGNHVFNDVIDVARRGITVRILLNDSRAFGHNKPRQSWRAPPGDALAAAGAGAQARPRSARKPAEVEMALAIQRLALCDKLPIEAKIVDVAAVEISYIHNKGMIFDHSKVLVSSINGTPNSMDNNREVAVLVQSPDAARYYQGFFEFDWTRSPSIQLPPEENIAPCQNQLVQDAGSGPAGFFPMTAFTGPQQTSGGASAPLAPATTEL